jgi:hypothetical protein
MSDNLFIITILCLLVATCGKPDLIDNLGTYLKNAHQVENQKCE